MAVKHFNLPDPGEGLLEAEIVTWHVAVGDTVKVNDIVVEVETAKSLVELPIPWAGTVVELMAQVGDEVAVGTPIIAIRTEGAGDEDEDEPPVKPVSGSGPKAESTTRRARRGRATEQVAAPTAPMPDPEPEIPDIPEPEEPVSHRDSEQAEPLSPAQERALAAPPVRKLAKDLRVDLQQVSGSGPEGRVTRADVEAAARDTEPAQASAPAPATRAGGSRGETRIPIKGVRKVTAAAMVGSAFTAPHVTEWITVDVTATMELVERLKADREFRDVKVTPLLVLAKAMCLAVKRNPDINAAWDEAAQEIVVKDYVNLGIAAATPRGLIVPNIKDADLMTMRELAEAIAALTETARAGRTAPADQAGGTITITNVGVFGVDTGTPILNPGEAAIMAFGVIRKQPWVVTVEGRDEIAIRHVTTLGLSFDHRLVDGELGSRYLADVAAIMGDPAKALVWS